jgi:ABC-2 type transport system ATP-binding protein
MANSISVSVADLRVVRGGREIISGLTTDVRSGEVTGLLGPSGCGKTTLMRSVVGVQRIHGGVVRVLGETAGSPALRRRVGYQTQAPSVYNDLTVAENLRFFASVLGVGAAEIERSIDTVDLRADAKSTVGRLSGGERARASLAVALLASPDVLVLDEPTVGLDPVLRRQLWNTFGDLARAGAAIIVSSHVMDEAERCDRLLLMREGRLIADDAPDALMSKTHSDDIEGAFLALVEERGAA